MTAGHIRSRGKTSWELKFDAASRSCHRQAQGPVRQLPRHQARRSGQARQPDLRRRARGAYVEQSKITVAEHVRARVNQWEAAGDISAKTAERYRELIEHQIVPHLGTKTVQKLKHARYRAVAQHAAHQRAKGRQGGVSARTIEHAHRILLHALKRRHAPRSGCRRTSPRSKAHRRSTTKKIQVVPKERIGELIDKLRGRAMYARAITACSPAAPRRTAGTAVVRRRSRRQGDRVSAQRSKQTKETASKLKSTKTKAGRARHACLRSWSTRCGSTAASSSSCAWRSVSARCLTLRLVFPAMNGGYQYAARVLQGMGRGWRPASASRASRSMR